MNNDTKLVEVRVRGPVITREDAQNLHCLQVRIWQPWHPTCELGAAVDLQLESKREFESTLDGEVLVVVANYQGRKVFLRYLLGGKEFSGGEIYLRLECVPQEPDHHEAHPSDLRQSVYAANCV